VEPGKKQQKKEIGEGESRTSNHWHMYHLTITPRVGQCVPDKMTFFFVLRHATRPNVQLAAQ